MSRLTNRDNEIFVGARCVGKSYFTRVFNKLSQLEDIEDELGIGLIKFHNLLRCGGYYRNTDENKIIFDYLHYESDIEQYVLGDIRNYVLPTEENYGRDWAFTKEELEQ